MAKVNCTACDELRNQAPDFSVNGVTKKVCNYLKNNTGLGGKSDNCTDLELANDCTIGVMDDVLDEYDICDWKDFMHKYIPNTHQMNKAQICSICAVWGELERLRCLINILFNGIRFSIGEKTTGDAYAVAGKGISFLQADGSEYSVSDLSLTYIAGGLVRGTGSYIFHAENFTDAAPCGNFDQGSDYSESANRLGNPIWNTTGRPVTGGELICEFRIKRSAYPQLRGLVTGFGQESGGGGYHVLAQVFNGRANPDPSDLTGYTWAFGQHGDCNADGTPKAAGRDHGHIVPDGWIYVQLRMTHIFAMNTYHSDDGVQVDGVQYTPTYFMGIRVNQDGVDC